MVVLGDSLAYGTGASSPRNGYAYRVFSEIKKTHPQSTYTNLAVPGATSVDVLRYQVPKLHRADASLVLLTVGSNDAFVYRDVAKFTKDYRRLLVAIRAAAPRARIVATGMPNASESSHVPDFARTIVATMCAMQNEAIAKESSAQGARVVDLYALTSRMKKSDRSRFLSHDDLHPSDAGYAEIANAALPVVRAALDSN
jgi:lysophospholipase L1-like esterase